MARSPASRLARLASDVSCALAVATLGLFVISQWFLVTLDAGPLGSLWIDAGRALWSAPDGRGWNVDFYVQPGGSLSGLLSQCTESLSFQTDGEYSEAGAIPLPLLLVAAVVALPALVLAARSCAAAATRARRRRKGQCIACAYPLPAKAAACPECGREADPARKRPA